ncbi:MAG: hypothetical protein QOD10_4254 [Mycobacterium sp.]|nr:hypothetical protein [Mycobacterium sp.]
MFDVSVPGLVAAAGWAVGFLVGVWALVTGHAGAAVVALAVAVVAPWFGAAWVSHGRRRAYHVALYLHGSGAEASASVAGSGPPARAQSAW